MVLSLTSLPVVFGGGTFERTFFDVRVFNPHAPSNRLPSFASCYRRHEQTKKRAYEQRCREVKHASFTPLVMSVTGGLANEATTFYKRLASLLSSKWDHSYSSTLCWLRCRLNFSLLRSSIQALRGSRSSIGHPIKAPVVVNLVNIESRILYVRLYSIKIFTSFLSVQLFFSFFSFLLTLFFYAYIYIYIFLHTYIHTYIHRCTDRK